MVQETLQPEYQFVLDAWFPAQRAHSEATARTIQRRRSWRDVGHNLLWGSGVGGAVSGVLVMYDRIGHTAQLHDAVHLTFYTAAAVGAIGSIMTGATHTFELVSRIPQPETSVPSAPETAVSENPAYDPQLARLQAFERAELYARLELLPEPQAPNNF